MAIRTKTTKARRRQVREQKARIFGRWPGRASAWALSWPVLAGVIFAGFASVIALTGERALPFAIGERVDQPIYARVDFQVLDEKKTQEEVQSAAAGAPSVYRRDAAPLVEQVRPELMRLYQSAIEAENHEAFQAATKDNGWVVSSQAFDKLHGMSDESDRKRFQELVDGIKLEEALIVRKLSEEDRLPPRTQEYFILEEGLPERTKIQYLDRRLTVQEIPGHLTDRAAQLARGFPSVLTEAARSVLLAGLKTHPTVLFDKDLTAAAIGEAIKDVEAVYTLYHKGQPIVNPHAGEGGGVLTAAHYDLLAIEQDAYLAMIRSDRPEAEGPRRDRMMRRIGVAATVTLITLALFVYVGMHQKRVLRVPSRTAAMGLLALGTLLAARLLGLNWPHTPELALTPCLIAASILAITYPLRFAFGVMAVVTVMVTVVVQGDMSLLLVLAVGVAVTIYQLGEIRTRTKIIGASLVTVIAVAVTTGAGALSAGQTLDYVWRHALWGAACALLAGFVVSGVLPFIERIFRIATSLTLLEWRDPTRPLLQLLARDAPGTYSHSLVLGTMAEAACETIGANGLLAQVGALYHDIGKIHKAGYFAENQEGRISRHDNLAPSMSLLIILAHVKDGVEMAKEYKLPRVLHQFIEEHHGTTVVRYFHHVASENQPRIASGKHDREVSEAEFRYSGPKPRSKESAVLMLCDSVEGAVRSLSEPTAGRIESRVHQIVIDRLNDGQFDDCDITLREISKVEDSLVKSLCGIYHGRVAYPKASEPGQDEEATDIPRPRQQKARPVAG